MSGEINSLAKTMNKTSLSLNEYNWRIEKDYKKLIWVTVECSIKEIVTEEIITYSEECLWDEENGTPHTWIWQEGNYSCDCNRRLFFLREKGLPEPKDSDTPCSHNKYLVNLKNPKTGEMLYQEF